jgi:hypothetical protein
VTTSALVALFIIPFVAGVVIPYATHWAASQNWPDYIETILNVVLSAAAAAIVSVSFDGNWQTYFVAFGVAWIGALRSHYTGLPQKLYSKRVNGRHEKEDQVA